MRLEDLSRRLSPQGFQPFAMNLSNGESYAITHPEQVLLDRSVAVIGTKRLNGARSYEKTVVCSLVHIVSLVPIEEHEVS